MSDAYLAEELRQEYADRMGMEKTMERKNYILRQLAACFHTGVFLLQDGQMEHYEENPEYNPLWQSEGLRLALTRQADAQTAPVVYRDDFSVYYLCVKKETDYYMMGPFSTKVMGRTDSHRFYQFYRVEGKWQKGLHYYTLMDILQIAGLLTKIVTGQEYSDQQLMDANYQAAAGGEEKQEQIRFDMKSEDEDIYRHSYQEERKIMDAVKSGNVEEAVRISKAMDVNIGRLGRSELDHWRNLAVIGATLCARAAIEGGVMPSVAYRVSGFYINKCTSCRDIPQILIYRNHAVEELASRVREKMGKPHTSSYTEQCKDYVYRNYRKKIYLEDIAETLKISPGYLSRLFKKETGERLQDFINDVRVEKAANLLTYSEEPLPGIAEYVGFPSQSYFGKIFKQKMKMTPKKYREIHKPKEFY